MAGYCSTNKGQQATKKKDTVMARTLVTTNDGSPSIFKATKTFMNGDVEKDSSVTGKPIGWPWGKKGK